jgi:hypothetical protein
MRRSAGRRGASGRRGLAEDHPLPEEAPLVSYRVTLDVPRELILFVPGLLAERRREIGTRTGTRNLGCYRQALSGLAWFRDKADIARLGAGSGLPQSTAYRYLEDY